MTCVICHNGLRRRIMKNEKDFIMIWLQILSLKSTKKQRLPMLRDNPLKYVCSATSATQVKFIV